MVFFNDPVPCPDPAERAVKMAMAMREAAATLIAAWRRHGCELGFGAGIAQGYATLGQIGFSERSGYTAIGTVCNLAARLCAEVKDGQILVSSHIAEAVEAVAAAGATALGRTLPLDFSPANSRIWRTAGIGSRALDQRDEPESAFSGCSQTSPSRSVCRQA